MTTTPKGYTELTNGSFMLGPEQINEAERFVENLIGENVANVAALPASGNWPGRTISVGDPVTSVYVWSTGGWVRTWSSGTPFAMAAGVADIVQSGTVVNFPAGRFTVPPIVTVAGGWVSATGAVGNPIIVKYAELLATRVTLLSTTAATVRGFWTAVQMTPTSAAG